MEKTGLTYTDLAEAAGLMADWLLKSEHAILDLSQRLAAAQGEVAALRGVLEYERERAHRMARRGFLRMPPAGAADRLC
jgi:hypothetical protein